MILNYLDRKSTRLNLGDWLLEILATNDVWADKFHDGYLKCMTPSSPTRNDRITLDYRTETPPAMPSLHMSDADRLTPTLTRVTPPSLDSKEEARSLSRFEAWRETISPSKQTESPR